MNSTHALEPEDVAKQVFDAISAQRFWILTHAKQMGPFIRARTEQIVTQTNPDRRSIDPDAAKTSAAIAGVEFA
jgi:hypothetical protein